MGKRIGIALGVLVVLVLLWWLFSGDDETEVTEEPAAIENAEPAPAD